MLESVLAPTHQPGAASSSMRQLPGLHQACFRSHHHKGDVIFRTGDAATDLFLIEKGQVKLVSLTAAGQERILAISGEGDFIGDAFLSAKPVYRVDAVALTDVTTCHIDREKFISVARQEPTLALQFASLLTRHLFESREQLSNSYDPIKVRLAKTLINYAERFGEARGEWVSLTTELRHEELASIISATRVSVSMAFAVLREEGLIVGTRGQYSLNLPGLRHLAASGV